MERFLALQVTRVKSGLELPNKGSSHSVKLERPPDVIQIGYEGREVQRRWVKLRDMRQVNAEFNEGSCAVMFKHCVLVYVCEEKGEKTGGVFLKSSLIKSE